MRAWHHWPLRQLYNFIVQGLFFGSMFLSFCCLCLFVHNHCFHRNSLFSFFLCNSFVVYDWLWVAKEITWKWKLTQTVYFEWLSWITFVLLPCNFISQFCVTLKMKRVTCSWWSKYSWKWNIIYLLLSTPVLFYVCSILISSVAIFIFLHFFKYGVHWETKRSIFL